MPKTQPKKPNKPKQVICPKCHGYDIDIIEYGGIHYKCKQCGFNFIPNKKTK